VDGCDSRGRYSFAALAVGLSASPLRWLKVLPKEQTNLGLIFLQRVHFKK
jgi:hypothetical protein